MDYYFPDLKTYGYSARGGYLTFLGISYNFSNKWDRGGIRELHSTVRS